MKNAAIRSELYRNKAEEVRIIAESMKQAASKAVLLGVAQDYLNFAELMDRSGEGDDHLPDLSTPRL